MSSKQSPDVKPCSLQHLETFLSLTQISSHAFTRVEGSRGDDSVTELWPWLLTGITSSRSYQVSYFCLILLPLFSIFERKLSIAHILGFYCTPFVEIVIVTQTWIQLEPLSSWPAWLESLFPWRNHHPSIPLLTWKRVTRSVSRMEMSSRVARNMVLRLDFALVTLTLMIMIRPFACERLIDWTTQSLLPTVLNNFVNHSLGYYCEPSKTDSFFRFAWSIV